MAWDNICFTPQLEELAKNCRAVCFGSLAQRNNVSQNTIYSFLDAMPENEDTYKIFDINLRQNFYNEKTLIQSLEKCNVLKINDEDLVIISKMFSFSEADFPSYCKSLLSGYNLKMVILTCGTNGSYVFTADEMSFVDTPQVEVADTVGAGDSFTATFVSSLLNAKSVKEAHHMAVEVSSSVCPPKGAMPGLPQRVQDEIK